MSNSTIPSKLMMPGKIVLSGFIGWLMFMNAQPWLELAEVVVPMMRRFPFLDALISIPFLGGWVLFLVENAISVVGVVFWGFIQFLEILPMLYDRETIYRSLIKQWQGKQFHTENEKNAGIKKLKEAYNLIPTEDVDSLNKYRMWAYIFELAGCLWMYLPYQGGIDGLVNDWPTLDADAILWPAVFMIPVTMFGFELLFKVFLRIWRLAAKAQK